MPITNIVRIAIALSIAASAATAPPSAHASASEYFVQKVLRPAGVSRPLSIVSVDGAPSVETEDASTYFVRRVMQPRAIGVTRESATSVSDATADSVDHFVKTVLQRARN